MTSDDRGIIFDIKRFAIHDGPGIRTTLFLKGCPLSCWWCHNPESQAPEPVVWQRRERCIRCSSCVEACAAGLLEQTPEGPVARLDGCTLCGACAASCPADARQIVGREVSLEALMDTIRRDVIYYDSSRGGVTISGGEPLVQPGFLESLLRACRAEEIHTAVDTCGFALLPVIRGIAGMTDLILFDLKVMDGERHRELTGHDNAAIHGNLRALISDRRRLIVRFPLIPGLNDDRDNLDAMGAFLRSFRRPPPLDILPYEQVGRDKYRRFQLADHLPLTEVPSTDHVARIAAGLERFGLDVTVRGET